MGLLDIYEGMQKQAEANAEVDERVELLSKYASAATELLDQHYPGQYGTGDVTKLAETLIVNDMQAEEQMGKVAEYVEAGQIMARSFIQELQNS